MSFFRFGLLLQLSFSFSMSVEVVRVAAGLVRGRRFGPFASSDRTALGFIGIPYAEPPLGPLRFEKPVPCKPWAGVKECTQFGPNCPYHSMTHNSMDTASEDCLYINVFTPLYNESISSEKLPVLVYIHGGGFFLDGANLLGDTNITRLLNSQDIVVVTLNYRHGLLGFLTVGDVIKGNYGMWDMTLALKWVQENIGAFGGDPAKVTVAGQSAGGAAADILSLSPHSRDLFQQLMCFAGTADSAFAIRDKRLIEGGAREFAVSELGLPADATQAQLVDAFRKADALKLAMGKPGSAQGPIGPYVDGDFLPKAIDQLRAEAPNKNFLTGLTEFECLPFSMMHRSFPSLRDSIPMFVKMMFDRTDVNKVLALYDQQVEQQLPDSSPVKFKQFVRFLGDLVFNHSTRQTVEKRVARAGRVYQYQFRYLSPNVQSHFLKEAPFQAASHCLELPYLFGANIVGQFQPGPKDWQMAAIFGKYLTNFVKSGNPNDASGPEWEAVDSGHLGKHFVFDLEPGMRNESLYSQNIDQFDSLRSEL